MTKMKKMEARVLAAWPDTGRALGLGRNATYDAIRRGEIPVLRFGRRYKVSKAVLDRMLAASPRR
ncbi:MAG: DNA-binding protein [Alphaproteobacteria bacterium]|nr:DNA-binding protein [Alphaproteobacteria bacterium]